MDEATPPTVSVAPAARSATDLPADAPWWAKWIIANAREGWKMFSVQWPVIIGVLIEIYQTFPDEVKAIVPGSWMPHLAAAAFLATAALRFVNQSKEPQ